jgi:hypothetical protein
MLSAQPVRWNVILFFKNIITEREWFVRSLHQVLTADGRLLTSFTQDAVIRALASPAASVPTSSRL